MPGFYWFRQDVDELDDDASLALAESLNDRDAWRFVVALKAWCTRYRPLGDVGRLGATALAQASRWRGDPEVFRDAFLAAGWVDEDGFLKGWKKNQWATFEKAARDRDAKRAERAAARAERQTQIPGTESSPIKAVGTSRRAPRTSRSSPGRKTVVFVDPDPDQITQTNAARAAAAPLSEAIEAALAEAKGREFFTWAPPDDADKAAE